MRLVYYSLLSLYVVTLIFGISPRGQKYFSGKIDPADKKTEAGFNSNDPNISDNNKAKRDLASIDNFKLEIFTKTIQNDAIRIIDDTPFETKQELWKGLIGAIPSVFLTTLIGIFIGSFEQKRRNLYIIDFWGIKIRHRSSPPIKDRRLDPERRTTFSFANVVNYESHPLRKTKLSDEANSKKIA